MPWDGNSREFLPENRSNLLTAALDYVDSTGQLRGVDREQRDLESCPSFRCDLRNAGLLVDSVVLAKRHLTATVDGFFQLRAGNELCDFFGRNFQRRAGLGVTAGSRLSRADGEGAESDQCHFASLLQRRYNSIERGIESITCLDFGHFRILRDLVN